MEKQITAGYIAISNLKKKPFRTAAMLAVIALSSAVLLGSLILTASLKGGIFGIQSRLGADLMIIPQGSEQELEGILLYGSPNYFYMDKNIEEIIRSVDGVQTASSQTYLASVSESCCDFPVQIIGFDPESDFIVKSWAKSRFGNANTDSETVFAGNNVDVQKKTVRFYGQTHKVLARLAKSGTGMDNAIYTDTPTLKNIFLDAKEKGFGFISGDDIDKKVSAIFVKLADGARPDSTALKIQRAVSEAPDAPAIQIIQNEKFISRIIENISSFIVILNAISILVIVITLLTLSVVFTLTINERLQEFSILRVLGADFNKLRKIVFTEAGIIGSIGAVLGIAVSALIILPFNFAISQKLNMPFILAGAGQIIIYALISFVILLAVCLIAAISGAVKVSKEEIYRGIK